MLLQTTISDSITVYGVNVYNGNQNSVRFHPARENSGLVFIVNGEKIFTNLEKAKKRKKAIWLFGDNEKAGMVEHLLSPIYVLGIDNLEIELSDGVSPTFESSVAEIFLILKDKRTVLDEQKKFWAYDFRKGLSTTVSSEQETNKDSLTVEFFDGFVVKDTVFYPHTAVRHQNFYFPFDEKIYEEQIMCARSIAFLWNNLFKDFFLYLGRKNLHGITNRNHLIITSKGRENYANPEEFGDRYDGEEFVRHKILDVLGTLALTGRQFRKTLFHFDKTGHEFDLYALKELFSRGCFKEVEE